MTKRERAIEAGVRAAGEMHANTGSIQCAAEAAIEAYHAIMAEPEPAEGMMRVRVCVAVDRYGRAGWYGDTTMLDDLQVSKAPPACQIHWIEADVPAYAPPAETTVRGRVVE